MSQDSPLKSLFCSPCQTPLHYVHNVHNVKLFKKIKNFILNEATKLLSSAEVDRPDLSYVKPTGTKIMI